MKRQLLLALLGLLAIVSQSPVRAQGWYYHNVGDTIRGRAPIYHYQWWSEEWLDNDPNENHKLRLRKAFGHWWSALGREEFLRYCYTEHPINVIGIAGSCHAMDAASYIMRDTTKVPEYLRIYDACPDSFPMKVSVLWQPTDPVRYMEIRQKHNEGGCYPLTPLTEYVQIHEYYFEDKPITLVDSFYVGGTAYSNLAQWSETMSDVTLMSMYWMVADNSGPGCPHLSNLYKYRYFNNNSDTIWHWETNDRFVLVFPIIEIDTSFIPPADTTPYLCPSVTGTRMVGFQEHAGYVAWNSDSEHTLYRVSYGPSGIQPDEGTMVETTHNFASLTGLDSCQHYVAYVQGVCNHQDSLYYSPWSDSISIYACNPQVPEPPDTTVGVRRPDLLDQMTHLVPNPASDVVQVMSSFRMKSLEVYALNGTRVLEQEADGVTATFSVSGMAPGTYIVQIHTRQGQLITKKLAVVGNR